MDTTPNQEVSDVAAEDRLASLFAEEESAPEAPEEDTAEEVEDTAETEEEPSETAPEDDAEEVEFEGKAYKVPKELKPALLRQSDYTKKTQELAEVRKQLADQRDFVEAKGHLLSQAQQDFAEMRAAEMELAKFQQVNWQELATADPGRAFALSKQQEQLNEFVKGKQARIAELAKTAEKAVKEHQARQFALAVEGARTMVGKVPPEADRKALQIVQDEFSQEELQYLSNAKVLKLVVEAAQWRLLQESKPGLNKRASDAKAVKPVSRSAPQAQLAGKAALARQTLKKTGSSNAAEAFMESLFSRRK